MEAAGNVPENTSTISKIPGTLYRRAEGARGERKAGVTAWRWKLRPLSRENATRPSESWPGASTRSPAAPPKLSPTNFTQNGNEFHNKITLKWKRSERATARNGPRLALWEITDVITDQQHQSAAVCSLTNHPKNLIKSDQLLMRIISNKQTRINILNSYLNSLTDLF